MTLNQGEEIAKNIARLVLSVTCVKVGGAQTAKSKSIQCIHFKRVTSVDMVLVNY